MSVNEDEDVWVSGSTNLDDIRQRQSAIRQLTIDCGELLIGPALVSVLCERHVLNWAMAVVSKQTSNAGPDEPSTVKVNLETAIGPEEPSVVKVVLHMVNGTTTNSLPPVLSFVLALPRLSALRIEWPERGSGDMSLLCSMLNSEKGPALEYLCVNYGDMRREVAQSLAHVIRTRLVHTLKELIILMNTNDADLAGIADAFSGTRLLQRLSLNMLKKGDYSGPLTIFAVAKLLSLRSVPLEHIDIDSRDVADETVQLQDAIRGNPVSSLFKLDFEYAQLGPSSTAAILSLVDRPHISELILPLSPAQAAFLPTLLEHCWERRRAPLRINIGSMPDAQTVAALARMTRQHPLLLVEFDFDQLYKREFCSTDVWPEARRFNAFWSAVIMAIAFVRAHGGTQNPFARSVLPLLNIVLTMSHRRLHPNIVHSVEQKIDRFLDSNYAQSHFQQSNPLDLCASRKRIRETEC